MVLDDYMKYINISSYTFIGNYQEKYKDIIIMKLNEL